MTRYEQLQTELPQAPKTWLITGVAGFIGSHLLEALLKLDQRVVGIDNFATGYQHNLDEVQSQVTPEQWSNFHFTQGDIRELTDCQRAMFWEKSLVVASDEKQSIPVDYVLHQAALGSVPRSLADPNATKETNISGFLKMLEAARAAQVQSFTYAASSSTYGDHPALPKVEESIGNPLSPYAVTKYVNELYARVFALNYGFKAVGLRYFNVFGPRQDANGAYAAVIPKWADALLRGETVYINGDGNTSRDFCFVANAVQANLLAACASDEAKDQVYNVAVGDRTTLKQLFNQLRDTLRVQGVNPNTQPLYREFREGDIRHSQANIEKARNLLGYLPTHHIEAGINNSISWYANKKSKGLQ